MRGPRRSSWARSAATALLVSTGCGAGEGGAQDAGTRPDATVVEVGLMFDDATVSDGGAVADASPRDAGWSLCRGSCDPVGAAGCATGVCVVRAETAECAPRAGRARRGAACATLEDCAAGLACFADGSGGGVCERVCCPGADHCGTAATCSGDGVLVDGTTSSWGRCSAPRACTLLDPMSCPDREACYVVSADGATECLLVGAALEGETCELPNDCAAGLVCTGAFMRTCATLCQLSTTEDSCPGPALCVRQAYTPEGIGVCVVASVAP
ncbi:MAG: hypothetical protein OHK0013_36690 [Sandaracinaceae bacterium]